jgi:hypothetical protein
LSRPGRAGAVCERAINEKRRKTVKMILGEFLIDLSSFI